LRVLKRSLVDLAGQNSKQSYIQRFRVLEPSRKALDAPGEFGKHEGVGEGFLNGFARRLEDPEALDVRLLRVLTSEIDEGSFFTALGYCDLNTVVDAFAQERGQSFSVIEVNGDKDGAR